MASTLLEEIKFNNVCELDISSLYALVRSSPVFHALYLEERVRILRLLLIRTIPACVLVDAVATLQAKHKQKDMLQKLLPQRDMVEQFLSDYRQLRGSYLTPYASDNLESQPAGEKLDISQLFSSLQEDDLVEISRLHRVVSGYVEHCMALGLEFLHSWLTKYKGEPQNALVRGFMPMNMDFLSQTMMEYQNLEYEGDYLFNIDGTQFTADTHYNRPNQAWTWSLVDGESSIYYFRSWADGLRQWGYVFWDQKRLRELDVEEKVRSLAPRED
ncbi:hypothetical protein FQN49_006996 [Arthroderma sp. PD_2]|nr:hypothetical protein FQN49_006996 [Arthroderma sp. PD_2]